MKSSDKFIWNNFLQITHPFLNQTFSDKIRKRTKQQKKNPSRKKKTTLQEMRPSGKILRTRGLIQEHGHLGFHQKMNWMSQIHEDEIRSHPRIDNSHCRHRIKCPCKIVLATLCHSYRPYVISVSKMNYC